MKIQDLVFIEKVEGRDKPNYHNVGILMTKDDGKQSVKLNMIPAGNSWTGWLSVFDRKAKDADPFD